MPTTTSLKKYSVTFSSPELQTLGRYIETEYSPAYGYVGFINDFLAVASDNGETNAQRILNSYTSSGEIAKLISDGIIATVQSDIFVTPVVSKSTSYKILDPYNLPIKTGTIFYIEYSKANQVSFLTEGIDVVSTDDVAFKAAKLAAIEADTRYFPVTKIIAGKGAAGTAKDIFPDVTVWIWCRSLSPASDEDGELSGQFFDLTPYVQNLKTNMGKNGGNFSLILPPLVCVLDSEGRWVIDDSTIIQYQGGYVAESPLFHMDNSGQPGENLVTNKFLFHKMIKSNDLIFIRFETLHTEAKQRLDDSKDFSADKKNLANRVYDMIGLVDSNSKTTDPASNDVTINIMGRDLSKLFLDDGCYFFALENSQGMLRISGGSELKNTLLSRIFAEKGMNFIGLYNFNSIENILKFIINQLSNIKVVPNDLFTSYNKSIKTVDGAEQIYDGRNKRFNEITFDSLPRVTQNNKTYTAQFKEEVANGIWQIVKLVIDSDVSKRRLADTSFSTAQGSLINFINSAIQEPLAEFYMDTYGDQYHLIIRKPPFDQKALISLIEGKVNTETGVVEVPPAIIDIESEDILQELLQMDDTNVYSWYQFYPKGAMINSSVDYSLSILPALFFDEYAQVFGSKPFQGSHAYVPYVPMSSADDFGEDLYEQAYSDLKYVVESKQYLPFTRKGTIIINGDRRIKIGNVIRYKPTGEIFFVDSVQQSFSINNGAIDRTTTINVSRGMIESFIYGVHLQSSSGATRFISYFNLIDTRLNIVKRSIQVPYSEKVKNGTKTVNKENTSLYGTSGGDNTNSIVSLQHPELVQGKAYLNTYNAYPDNKKIFIKFINAITSKGYQAIILPLAANRTYAQQAAIYVENIAKGIPAAKPGHSKHEFGKAIDVSVINKSTGKYYHLESPEADWRATGIPDIANSLGLQWGDPNNNGAFGSSADRVHFELGGIDSPPETIEVDNYEEVTKYRTVQSVDQSQVFNNFKVNKATFNFFLKNRQFDPDYRKVKSRTIYSSDQQGSLTEVIVRGKKKSK